MATWKKILVEGDAVANNIATADLTQSGSPRIYDVGSSQVLNFDDGIVNFRDSSGNQKVQISPNSGVIGLLEGSSLQFRDADNTNSCTIDVPTNITANYAITLPSAGPTSSGQILESDGSGNLSWIATPSGSSDTHLGNTNLTADNNRTYDQDGNDLVFDPNGGEFAINDSSGLPTLAELSIAQGQTNIRGVSVDINGITYPSVDGTNGQVMTTDGSGNLSFQTASGGVTINNNTDNYLLTATGTANTINGEGNLRFDGTELGVSGYLEYQPDANVRYGEFYDGSENGPYMGASGNSAGDLMLWVKDGSVAAFKVHTINGAGGQPELLDASSSSTNINQIAGITVIASSTSSSFYVRGMVTIPQAAVNGTFSSSYGDPLYLDPASAGVLTLTAPTTSNAYRRQMGYLVNKVVISTVTYYIIWFDPSPEYVKIA